MSDGNRDRRSTPNREVMRLRHELAERMRCLSYEELVRIFQEGVEEEARMAAITLGDLGDQRAFPLLLHALETADNHGIMIGAALGLRELGDPRAIEPLMEKILDPTVVDPKGSLVYALQTLNPRSRIVDIARLMCEEGYARRLWIVGIVEELHGPLKEADRAQAVGLLQDCLNRREADDADADMMRYVIELLGEHETEP